MNEHHCIGGPFNGQLITWQTAYANGYTQFNCAGGCNRTKLAKKRAEKEGRIIPPSMIYLHNSLFKELS